MSQRGAVGRSGPRQTAFLPDRLALAGKKMRSGAGAELWGRRAAGQARAGNRAEADRYAGAELDRA
jgi:hypothetical protein